MTSRGQGAAGGRGNRERADRGKRPMVDPDPIRELVEETFEEGELSPIIMGQPTAPSTQVEVGERSSAGQKKKKKKKKKKKNGYQAESRGVESKDGALPPFDTTIKTRMELWAQSVPYQLMDEYKIWIKTKVFKDWSDASYERMVASHIVGKFKTYEGKAWLVTKSEMLERWLNAGKISDLTKKIGQGSYGAVYRVGFLDVALGLELGMEGVVPYVAKKCDEKPPYNAWVMMHKELASFAETH
ncbi:hypothetical protein R1sor_003048 [Riccia sorocarpa]|uniref:Protein kinase domain-containing protein n=1 Tax=Riccia sorocarpa TaxID=122646 RepID=A0ABD3H265_9MARC